MGPFLAYPVWLVMHNKMTVLGATPATTGYYKGVYQTAIHMYNILSIVSR